jgi:2-polyprenyl-3-methyl-5-hydroxy-6-metoxy-1,4-benzoquinol methylase
MTTAAERLCVQIAELMPGHQSFLDASLAGLRPADRDVLESYLQYCLARGAALDYLAQSYEQIVRDTLREQLYFQRHRRYRYARYAEVAQAVYHNETYMRQYMYGLALTTFLWPNHRQLKEYFERVLPAAANGRYLEVGPGHGFYFMTAMRRSRYTTFEGIDISATSVRMTCDLLDSGHFGPLQDYAIHEGDFLQFRPAERYDAVVIGEVLEHVEQPQQFLAQAAALSTARPFIFVTTCINAPAIDHLSLFESAAQLHELASAAGLVVQDECLAPYPGKSLTESMHERLPVNIALVLGKES